MSITLLLFPSYSGYRIFSNKDDINHLIIGKTFEESIKLIKAKYQNKSITVKIYDYNNHLKKINYL